MAEGALSATVSHVNWRARNRPKDLSSDEDISKENDDESLLDGGRRRNGRRRKKLSRNESEKMRRVRIKNYLMELAALVPSIITAHKKLDKTSILRLTVNFLRIHNELMVLAAKDGTSCPNFLEFEKLRSILMEILSGFILILDRAGTILYSSESIVNFLGINVVDVLGQPITCILHPDDERSFYHLLTPPNGPGHKESGSYYQSTYIRLRSQTKGQVDHYDLMHFIGHFKEIPSAGAQKKNETEDRTSSVLIGVVQPVNTEPKPEEPLVDDNLPMNQYISWHDLNGTTTDADSRAALITGYCPVEMHGLSAYEFIHPDDIPYAVNAHLTMLRSNGSVIPNTLLRLKRRDSRYLYSSVSSHLVLHMWTKKPRFLISVNVMLEPEEGERLLDKQQQRLQNLDLNSFSAPDVPDNIVDNVLETASSCASSGDHCAHSAQCLQELVTAPDNTTPEAFDTMTSINASSSAADSPDLDMSEDSGMKESAQSDIFSVMSKTDASPPTPTADIDECSLVNWMTTPNNTLNTTISNDLCQQYPNIMDDPQCRTEEIIEGMLYSLANSRSPIHNLPGETDCQNRVMTSRSNSVPIAEPDTKLSKWSLDEQMDCNEVDERFLTHPMLFCLLTCESDEPESIN